MIFEYPDLVIFDFDGVIVDSEVLSLKTLRDTLALFSFELDVSRVRQLFLGKSLASVLEWAGNERQDFPEAHFIKIWEETLYARFRNELQPMADIALLITQLRTAGIPYCIASSSTFERIDICLEAVSLKDHFENIFSAQLVTRGKPAPDLFLLAAQTLKIQPRRCLVIEDSPYGIRAAGAAGMQSVGFVGGRHLEGIRAEHSAILREAGADMIVTRHRKMFPLRYSKGHRI